MKTSSSSTSPPPPDAISHDVSWHPTSHSSFHFCGAEEWPQSLENSKQVICLWVTWPAIAVTLLKNIRSMWFLNLAIFVITYQRPDTVDQDTVALGQHDLCLLTPHFSRNMIYISLLRKHWSLLSQDLCLLSQTASWFFDKVIIITLGFCNLIFFLEFHTWELCQQYLLPSFPPPTPRSYLSQPRSFFNNDHYLCAWGAYFY